MVARRVWPKASCFLQRGISLLGEQTRIGRVYSSLAATLKGYRVALVEESDEKWIQRWLFRKSSGKVTPAPVGIVGWWLRIKEGDERGNIVIDVEILRMTRGRRGMRRKQDRQMRNLRTI